MAKARRGRKGESIGGFFRKIYQEKPELLHIKSNDDVFRLWLDAHPGYTAVPPKVRANAANVKSSMKRKLKAAQSPQTRKATAARVRAIGSGLESLEEAIDDCLIAAKRLDREGLENVIRNLRRARNEVVLKIG